MIVRICIPLPVSKKLSEFPIQAMGYPLLCYGQVMGHPLLMKNHYTNPLVSGTNLNHKVNIHYYLFKVLPESISFFVKKKRYALNIFQTYLHCD